MKRLIILLVIILVAFGGYYLLSDQVLVSYYASKTDQAKETVQTYADKANEYKAKIKEDATNFDYRVELARSYEYMGRIDKAIDTYKEVGDSVVDESAYVYHNNLGKLYEKKGEWQKAIDEYNAIVTKFPDQYTAVHLNLANVYLELNNVEQAQQEYFYYRSATGNGDGAFEQRLENFTK
ncbi:MAG: tetratricopeptide repeat protein [bacterium]